MKLSIFLIFFVLMLEDLPKTSSILISPELRPNLKKPAGANKINSTDDGIKWPQSTPPRGSSSSRGKPKVNLLKKQKTEARGTIDSPSLYYDLDSSLLSGVFDYEGGLDYGGLEADLPIAIGHSVHLHDHHPTIVTTVTATRHLTSHVTSVVTDTKLEYITIHKTEEVSVTSFVPSYVTSYVTKFITEYVTQKYPVFKTKVVTEHHTQIHTKFNYKTKYETKSEVAFDTHYVTQTSYATQIQYQTDTLHRIVTQFLSTTVTEYQKIPYQTTLTVYDSVYLTSTYLVPYSVTTTVYEPQYTMVNLPGAEQKPFAQGPLYYSGGSQKHRSELPLEPLHDLK